MTKSVPTIEPISAPAVFTPDVHPSTAADSKPLARLHLFMFVTCAVLLVVSIVGFYFTVTTGMPSPLVALCMLLPSAFPAVIWHDRKQYERRDAALTLPWIVSLILLIPLIAVLSGRLGFPMCDLALAKMDKALGISVSAIMTWTGHHPRSGALLGHSYGLLPWMLAAAIIIPILAGNRNSSERFILANTIALLVSMPIFTLFPAVGPWLGYHFRADAAQAACEFSIAQLHHSARIDSLTVVGVVCFPSFHVIWALLSAVALWPFPVLRAPAVILAALIIASTVTTGWHYSVDVLAGLILATVSVICADVSISRLRKRTH